VTRSSFQNESEVAPISPIYLVLLAHGCLNYLNFNSFFRRQIEVLHVSKEEREAALMQPLCELILDWSQRQWLDDGNLTIDNFTAKVCTGEM